MKVLIVDDAIFMRSMLRGIFEKAGHTVCGEAITGREAIEQYEKLQPEIVTMDVIMPDMSGVEAVKEIMNLDSNAKILVVSAMGQKTIIDEMLKAGAVDYVVKPFLATRILDAVQKTACTTGS